MKKPVSWLQRKFDYQIDPDLLPCVIDRLAGVPARMEDKVKGLGAASLTWQPHGKWSIQEHIGHLLDLEELGLGRIEDFKAGKNVLRAADMENCKTHQANHNLRPIGELLTDFRSERMRLVEAFLQLDDETLGRVSVHPRLQKPMGVVDFAHFHAEHDDHHLAMMSWIIGQIP